MTTNIPAFAWKAYQGSLIYQTIFDSAVDTDFRIPINAFFQNASVTADGIIIDNTENQTRVALTIGNVLAFIPPFIRSFLTLDKNVGLNLQVGITSGQVLATLYKGPPPFEVSLTNYYGAANAVVPNLQSLTASLAVPVAVIGGAGFTDGPSLAQGTVGTWYASGNICVRATALSVWDIVLWDGVTVMDAADANVVGGDEWVYSLSGRLVTPAGNLRISLSSSAGNATIRAVTLAGTAMASTITAFRVA